MAKKTTPKKKVALKVTAKKATKKIKPVKSKPKKQIASKKTKTKIKLSAKKNLGKKIAKPEVKKILKKKAGAKKVTSAKSKKIATKPKTAKKIQVKAKPKIQPKKLLKPAKSGLKVLPGKKNTKPATKKAVQKIIPKSAKKTVKARLFPKKISLKPMPDGVIPVRTGTGGQAGKLAKSSVKAITRKEQPKVQTVVKKPIQITSSVALTATKPVQEKTVKKQKAAPIKTFQNYEANYNRANMFYKNVLKAEIVKRYSYDNKEDKEFLKRDISLTIKMNDKETTISEKLRDQDWNDIYVEIFRKYPHEDGWIKVTEAEYLGYFFPGRVFWAKMEPIVVLCQDIISKAIGSGIYKELLYMYPKNSGRLSKTFKINTKTYSFNFIQTYHEEGDNSYYSIGISLPFVLLMDFRIYYKIYKQ